MLPSTRLVDLIEETGNRSGRPTILNPLHSTLDVGRSALDVFSVPILHPLIIAQRFSAGTSYPIDRVLKGRKNSAVSSDRLVQCVHFYYRNSSQGARAADDGGEIGIACR